jgi:hypothetical protein
MKFDIFPLFDFHLLLQQRYFFTNSENFQNSSFKDKMEVTVPERRTCYGKNVEIHKFIYLGVFLENKGTEYTKK